MADTCLPFLTGSPPQVRGKPQEKAWNPAYGRITPAGAGKTCPCGSSGRHAVDHPRRCGENRMMMSIVGIKLGSPPQVRGKPRRIFTRQRGHRITPAGAGKTCCKQQSNRSGQDHPRRCGENSSATVSAKIGSRITPAGAGKTCMVNGDAFSEQDHPRRCGENYGLLPNLARA